MDKKYLVPSLQKANTVLQVIASHPEKLRLIDIARKTNINKSSLYSLLNTLEYLHWIEKKYNTYSIGKELFSLGSLYLKGSNLVDIFLEESITFVNQIKETMQISKLDNTEIIYLAKKEGNDSVQLTSKPGMKIPAHTTAMGKVLLSEYSFKTLRSMYKGEILTPRTPYTVQKLKSLQSQITYIKKNGYIQEYEEAVEGFNCISAPIYDANNHIIAAVSITIPTYNWDEKNIAAKELIKKIAKKISEKVKKLNL